MIIHLFNNNNVSFNLKKNLTEIAVIYSIK